MAHCGPSHDFFIWVPRRTPVRWTKRSRTQWLLLYRYHVISYHLLNIQKLLYTVDRTFKINVYHWQWYYCSAKKYTHPYLQNFDLLLYQIFPTLEKCCNILLYQEKIISWQYNSQLLPRMTLYSQRHPNPLLFMKINFIFDGEKFLIKALIRPWQN